MKTLIYTGEPLRRILPGGQVVERGKEFDVIDELADHLLEQPIFELKKEPRRREKAPETEED